ncbi:MAG: 30S ribosomal protein S24e [Methanocellales archaeon]|nr:30S ribosomal protein S24e [Methanocellales archaeon]
MEIAIITDKRNPLLKRREIKFKINHDTGTPKRNDVKGKLAAMLNAKPKLVVIERMRSEFGKRETLGYVKIYDSEKHLKRIERPHIVERNAPKSSRQKAQRGVSRR